MRYLPIFFTALLLSFCLLRIHLLRRFFLGALYGFQQPFDLLRGHLCGGLPTFFGLVLLALFALLILLRLLARVLLAIIAIALLVLVFLAVVLILLLVLRLFIRVVRFLLLLVFFLILILVLLLVLLLFLLFLLFQSAVQVVHRIGTVGLALQAFNIRSGRLLELARIHQKIPKVVQGIALLQWILRGLCCLHQGLGGTLGIAGLLQSGSLVELWDKGIGLLCTGRII